MHHFVWVADNARLSCNQGIIIENLYNAYCKEFLLHPTKEKRKDT